MDQNQSPRGAVEIRVRVADTDLMGVVYNSVYLVWFEVGRTELMRDRGISYAEVEERGFSLPVTEAILKVRRPAQYDDIIRVETEVGAVRSREITFHYRMFRETQLLVEGETVHVAVRHSDRRSSSLPPWLLSRL